MIAGEASGIIKGYLKSARLSLGGDNRLFDRSSGQSCGKRRRAGRSR